MDYTPTQAARRATDGMFYPPANVEAWFNQVRAQLASAEATEQRQ
ncbi:hypothetical protein [Micromonospora tulbaghiae]|nr:hypothetical protein [Micromonospora tulbaghiae]